jgi:hypothetical protein
MMANGNDQNSRVSLFSLGLKRGDGSRSLHHVADRDDMNVNTACLSEAWQDMPKEAGVLCRSPGKRSQSGNAVTQMHSLCMTGLARTNSSPTDTASIGVT